MSEKNTIAPNLLSFVDVLEDKRTLIAGNWVKNKVVKSVFSKRKISSKKFALSYGVPIIEYFISVVKGAQVAGDCPIMSKFVKFMISKDITPKEVFDICIGFRRSLITFMLSKQTVSQNPDVYMDEISEIFDANLSGVLDIFTNLYAESQKKIEIAKSQKDKLQQTLKIINSIKTKIIIVQDGRIILANKPFLEMTGVRDLKCLYLKYTSGFEYLSDVSLYEDEYKEDISKWIKKVCEENKSFQCAIYNEKAKKIYSYSGRITVMPVENVNQYIIALSNISEHIKDEKAIVDMLNHDELTGFRNYPTFENLTSKMIDKAKENKLRLFLAIVDIANLRYINDVKGASAGDMAISEVAEDLRFMVNKNIYLSRLNGSRFGVLLQYETEQAGYDWCIELYKKMKEHESKKIVAITEIDLNENINKSFLRSYDLIDQASVSGEEKIAHDFDDIIEYIELPDQKEFTDRLGKLKTLEMTLYFMELPIAADSKILSSTTDNAKISLSAKQIKIAKVGMKVYFKLERIGNIKASIKDIDEDNRRVTIDSFVIDKHTPLNRIAYRIQAGDDIKAYISENGRDYKVKVLDMNKEYIAVSIDRKRNFDINSLVYIDMLLPITDVSESCVTNATVTRIDNVPGGYKMVLLCHFDDSTQELLSRYIAKHQMDIIKNFQH